MGVISIKPDDLFTEWTAAEDFHRSMVDGLDAQLDRYKGEQKAKNGSRAAAAIMPHEFEWISKMMARLAYDVPRFIGGTQSQDPLASQIAQATAHAVNTINVQTNFRNEAILACLDFQLAPAIFRVEMQEFQAQGEVRGAGPGGKGYGYPQRPVLLRESPLRTRWDPRALNTEAVEWTAWASIHDRKALIKHARENPDEGWDLPALNALSGGSGVDEIRGDTSRTAPPRDEVGLIHFWIRNADTEALLRGVKAEDRHKFHGALCTIAISGESEQRAAHQVRKPRPFFGPPCGPLVIGYAYPFFDVPGGMGATRPVRGIVEALNRQITAENERAEGYRSGTIVDGSERVIEKVKHMLDRGIVALPGADRSKVIPFEIQGATERGQAQIQILMARLAQAAAMSPAASGTVTGKGTATENNEASNALDERTAFQKMQWNDLVRRAGRAQAWYAYYSNRVVIDLPPDASLELGGQPGVQLVGMNPDGSPKLVAVAPRARFFGGDAGGRGQQGEFELMQITIEPDSMGWNSPDGQLRQLAMANEEIAAFGGLVSDPRYAHVDWELRGRMLTQVTGNPYFERAYNLKAAAQIAQSQALAEQSARQEQAKSPAKLGSEAGMRPQAPRTGGGGSYGAQRAGSQRQIRPPGGTQTGGGRPGAGQQSARPQAKTQKAGR